MLRRDEETLARVEQHHRTALPRLLDANGPHLVEGVARKPGQDRVGVEGEWEPRRPGARRVPLWARGKVHPRAL